MEEVGGDEFRSHNHAERLMRKMETCASKRQLCDVVLIAGNKRIPAHRLVLSAASDYFAAMFMNNVREASMEEVELKDVDPDALASLVQYTYTGRVSFVQYTYTGRVSFVQYTYTGRVSFVQYTYTGRVSFVQYTYIGRG